jgi:hypothetical protein
MRKDEKSILEAYVTQVPTTPAVTLPSITKLPTNNTQEQEESKKQSSVKDWIRLPFIDTPFKARMAAVLIVELIHNLTRDPNLRDLVLKEIRTNNRLSKRR